MTTAWQVFELHPFSDQFWSDYPNLLCPFRWLRPRVLRFTQDEYAPALNAGSCDTLREMLQHVETLTITTSPLRDVYPFSLPKLECITLYWQDHCDEFFTRLVSVLQRCDRLRAVHVYGLAACATKLSAWEHFLRLPVLTLYLDGAAPWDRPTSQLSSLPLGQLCKLGISDFKEGILKTVAAGCTRLKEISIQRTNIADVDFVCMRSLPLTALTLRVSSLSPVISRTISGLPIRELDLKGVTDVAEDDAVHMFMALVHLESLSLGECSDVLQRAVIWLKNARGMRELRWDCQDTEEIEDKSSPSLLERVIVTMPFLADLRLGCHCKLSDSQLRFIVTSLTSLRRLDIDIAATDETVQIFEPATVVAISQLAHLETLFVNLAHFIDFTGPFARHEGFTALQLLYVQHREFTDRPAADDLANLCLTLPFRLHVEEIAEIDDVDLDEGEY